MRLNLGLTVAFIATCFTVGGNAQSRPDAGTVLRENTPREAVAPVPSTGVQVSTPPNRALSASAQEVTFSVRGVRFEGNSIFTEESLSPLVATLLGDARTIADLELAAAHVTNHYRTAGYMVARAYIPQQRLPKNAVISIAILEGKLSDVGLKNESLLSDEAASGLLNLIPIGRSPMKGEVDRAVLLLGDLAGSGPVEASLAPGTQQGDTLLNVRLTGTPLWSSRLEADNHGGLYTGRNRLGVSVDANSPFGYGERFSTRLLASDSDLLNGRLAGQIPVGGNGLTVGAALARTTYELGDSFAALDAVGRSDTAEVFARYPVLRSVGANLYTQLGWEQRKLRDEVRSTATQTDKSAHVSTLSLQGDARDSWGGGGFTQGSLALTMGKLNIDSPTAAALDAAGANTAGTYTKWAWSLDRQQAISQNWSLHGQLRGQWAGKNLDSSEKFSLGGPNGVRAYASGEASGDRGWLASLDLRYAVTPELSASLFYDQGRVTVNALPYLSSANTQRRSGTGLGLSGNHGAFDWRIALAWRGSEVATAEPDEHVRVWAQASWRF